MGKFFESEIVREQLEAISKLQQEIYGNTMSFPTMPRADKLEHVDKLTELLDKQEIMYARLSLSDDPQALTMKKHLEKSVELMGFPSGTDVSILFDGMAKTIEKLKRSTDVD